MPKLEVKVVSAGWCQPCKNLKPVIKSVCEDHDIELQVSDVDTKEGSSVSAQYGVRGVPTTFIFEGGEVKNTFVGMISRSELEKSLN